METFSKEGMSLAEAKEKISKDQGFNSWFDYQLFMKSTKVNTKRYEIVYDEIAKAYASSKVEALEQRVKELENLLIKCEKFAASTPSYPGKRELQKEIQSVLKS